MKFAVESASSLVPEPVAAAWRGRASGPALRLAAAAVAVPLAVTVLFGSAPAGIYLNGLIIGSLYALIAIGLILVYRANRIVNFAQASMGSAPAVAAVLLYTNRHWPYLACVAVMLAGSVTVGLVVETVFIRRFAKSPRLILTVATIGIAQLLTFFEFLAPRWVGGNRNLQNSVQFKTPLSRFHTEIAGSTFRGDHLLVVVAVVLVATGLGAFFRFTDIGMAIRASAENSERASLLGIPVRRVSTIVWVIGALISGIGVFLRVPVVGGLPFGGLVGASTLLYGLAPAVIARMQSIPVAFAAGVGIGVVDQTVFYTTRNSTISGALILPIVLGALLLQRASLSRAEDAGVTTWQQVKEFRPVPPELRAVPEVVAASWAFRVVVAAFFVGLPFLVGELRRDLASLLLIYAIAGVSLVILTGWAGQISLGQFAFVGVGAAVAGGLVAKAHADFVVAMVGAGLAGAVVAIAIGIPALRLPGLFLAVTTLAFAANTQYFFLQREYFGWVLPDASQRVLRPVLWHRLDLRSDLAYYYVCLAVLALAVASARSLRSHRSGRVLIAARDNMRAAQSYGVNLPRTRLAAFALSGFFAAVAGGLFVHLQGVVDPAVFTPTRSLQVFAMTVIGGLTSIPGAIAGAIYVIGFQYFLPDYQLLATGLGMLVLLLFFPGGLSQLGFNLRDGFLRWVAERHELVVPSLVADTARTAARPVVIASGVRTGTTTPSETPEAPAPAVPPDAVLDEPLAALDLDAASVPGGDQ